VKNFVNEMNDNDFDETANNYKDRIRKLLNSMKKSMGNTFEIYSFTKAFLFVIFEISSDGKDACGDALEETNTVIRKLINYMKLIGLLNDESLYANATYLEIFKNYFKESSDLPKIVDLMYNKIKPIIDASTRAVIALRATTPDTDTDAWSLMTESRSVTPFTPINSPSPVKQLRQSHQIEDSIRLIHEVNQRPLSYSNTSGESSFSKGNIFSKLDEEDEDLIEEEETEERAVIENWEDEIESEEEYKQLDRKTLEEIKARI
jgi:hypothetical protein